MNRWLIRVALGLATGLIGLYFQYSMMQKQAADAPGSVHVSEGEGEPLAPASPGGIPASLLEQVRKGQSSGGGRRGRARGRKP